MIGFFVALGVSVLVAASFTCVWLALDARHGHGRYVRDRETRRRLRRNARRS